MRLKLSVGRISRHRRSQVVLSFMVKEAERNVMAGTDTIKKAAGQFALPEKFEYAINDRIARLKDKDVDIRRCLPE